MSIETWLGFVTASLVLLAIPGPTVLLIVSYALGEGRRSAVATVAGVALGDFTAMTVSLLGLGVLLTASAELFTLLKWLGAGYLVFLGIKLWRAPVSAADPAELGRGNTGRLKMFLHAYAVTALNPKGLVFFVAFLPQFLDTQAPVPSQLLIMGATFLVLATLIATLYAMLASTARRAIRNPSVQRGVNRVGGSMLIVAGVLTATWRKAAA